MSSPTRPPGSRQRIAFALAGGVAAVALAVVLGSPRGNAALLALGWWLAVVLLAALLGTPSQRGGSREIRVLASLLIGAASLLPLAMHESQAPNHDLTSDASLVVVLALAGVAVWALARSPGRPSLAAGALAALGGVAGLQTRLWRAAPASTPDVRAFGYSVTTTPSFAQLFVDWRLNAVFAALALAAVAAYLVAVRTLHRHGVPWPPGRTIAWLTGWLIVVLATSSGIGRFAPAMFSVHMTLNLTLNMFAAMVLALAGPFTLARAALTAAGRRAADGFIEAARWRSVRFVTHPLVALALMTGSYYVIYFGSLFPASLPRHWLHQAICLAFLAIGCLFYTLIIGVDQPPRELPHIGKLGLIIGAMPFHAFFGVIILSRPDVIALPFYDSIHQPWMKALAHDQFIGGSIAWAGGEFPLLIALISLLVQWWREDKREASEVDAQIDAGGDALDAYNEMLARLAENDRSLDNGRHDSV